MAKVRGVDAKLLQLKELRAAPVTPELVAQLRRMLADASSLVVAGAAEILGERAIKDLTAEMVQAFERMMIEPEETDRNCVGKIAIVRALNALDFQDEAIYLKGLEHVQNPIFGTPDDAASALRGDCAFALARIGHPDLVVLLIDRLVEHSPNARRYAVQALGASGRSAAVPLLRLKAKVGDANAAVTAECLSALMTLAPKESLRFVAPFLQHPNDEIRDGALFALAESRQFEVLALLLAQWPSARRTDFEEALLLGISMQRQQAALDFLLGILRDEPRSAPAALAALAIHRHQPALKAAVAEIVATMDSKIQALFEKKF